MCQARRDGGRRCPIHRHDSVAGIQLAVAKTKLEPKQVENIFRELTREGRTSDAPEQQDWDAYKNDFRQNLGKEDPSSVTRNMDKADEHSSVPDGKTFYAMTKLQERVGVKSAKLNELFAQVSREKGVHEDQLRAQFASNYESAHMAYGQGNPEGYSQRAYTQAKSEGLPYDTQSVVAIDKLRKTEAVTDNEPRVNRIPVHTSSFISEIGYNSDGGRLEIVMSRNPETVYAYQNVPLGLWSEMVHNASTPSRSLGSIYSRQIRNNPDYQYENIEEAQRDANSVHCATCGQFSSPVSHSCPGHMIEPEAPMVPRETLVENEVTNDAAPIPDDYGEVESKSEEPSAQPLKKEVANVDSDQSGIRAAARISAFEKAQEAERIANWEENRQTADQTGKENSDQKEDIPVPESSEYNPASPTPVNQPENNGLIELDYSEDYLSKVSGGSNSRFVGVTGRPYSSSVKSQVDLGEFKSQLEGQEDRVPPLVVSIVENYETNTKVIVGVTESPTFYASFSRYRKPDGSVGQIAAIPSPDTAAYKADEDTQWTRETFGEVLQEREARGIEELPQRSSFIKTLDMESNHPNVKWKVKVPTSSNLKKAVVGDKPFSMPIEVDFPSTPYMNHISKNGIGLLSREVIDDQGYRLSYDKHKIAGSVVFEKNKDGNFEAKYDQRTLRCECYIYRKHYNCPHIDHVLRKSNNIIAQLAVPTPQRSVEDLAGSENAQYLSPALARRSDLEVIPPKDDSEKPIYVFTETNGNQVAQSRWMRNVVFDSYRDPIPEINSYASYKEYGSNIFDSFEADEMQTTNAKRDLTTALRRGPAQIPVKMTIRKRSINPTENKVEGTVVLENDEDGKPKVISHQLKCTCDEYREKYNCVHVRCASEQSRHIPFVGQREYNVDYTAFRDSNSERRAIAETPEFQLYREMHNIARNELRNSRSEPSESELETLARENIARLEEEEIERNREREEREARYQAMRAEENRTEALRAKQRILEWRERNTEMAESLDEHKSNLLSKWDSVESSYSNDREKLNGAIKDALDRKKNGESAIPFRAEGGVLDGASSGIGGRKFGVELEFELPNNGKREALANIGRELHEAGLTTHAGQDYYHSAGNNGYRNWSFEEDCTVSGELVSPILDDSPESWRQLKVATDIIRKHGGKGGTRSGSHVHVSTGTYEMSTAKRAELLRLNGEYQDTIHRLATSPERGTHRGVKWCEPNVKDSAGELHGSVEEGASRLGYGHGHGQAVNLGAMGESLKSSNVEFRNWDGTMDPGTIQAQVMMSVAMTDRAELNVMQTGYSKPREKTNFIGSAHSKETKKFDGGKEGGFASFLDTMFRKDEDKNHIASLFAVTNWQKG